MLLDNKVAIITGGAVGIGKGIALRFAGEGCSVVIADISRDEGQKTAEQIVQKGGRGIFISCDVTQKQQVQNMAQEAISKFGGVDILVNNAGGVIPNSGYIDNTTEEQWDKIIDLNLKSQFLCSQAVIPQMKDKKYGKIVNISSMGAICPPAPIVHYHAAKGGVLSLTTNFAFELARHNITVNAILPGPVITEFYTDLLKDVPDKEAFFARLRGKVPMQRIGTVDEVASVALFLASELSSYVTGQAICVGGGLPLPVME